MVVPHGIFFEGPKGRSERSKLLIVEGSDDAYVFDKLFFKLNFNPNDYGIIYTTSNTLFEKTLVSLTKSSAYKKRIIRSIALISDADDKPIETLNNLHNALRKVELPCPDHCQVIHGGNVDVGIYIIPSITETGDIEKLCLKTIESDRMYIFVKNFYNIICRQFLIVNKHYKRIVRIFLSCCRQETRGLGLAFRDGIFNADHSALTELKEFLRNF